MSIAPTPQDLAPRPTDPDAAVQAPFQQLKAAWRAGRAPTLGERDAMLDRMARWCVDHQDEIAQTISSDFGGRSRYETLMGEIWVTVEGIRHAQKHLRRWMRPQGRSVYWVLRPATGRILRQPLGVVGIMAPWNYPWQLAVAPMTAAIAAGNKVLLKPSELTPATSALLTRMVGEVFSPDQVQVVEGDASVGAAFSRLPFDHLLFTGSTHVGRLVMKAAAENLVPVTLELGGKSPTLVHPSFDAGRAAPAIARGKWFNAGQTCIAPDYVITTPERVDVLVDALREVAGRFWPSIADNDDYTAIVSERHYARLKHLLDDAVSKGARAVWLHSEGAPIDARRKLPPVVLLDVDDSMQVMQEEIFGPILPIVTVPRIEDAVGYVNDRPRPLALYVFDDDAGRADEVLQRTVAGGCVVNDTLLHIANEDLPFGGVGPSGIGAYHGEAGFLTFSHQKSVFYQARLNGAGIVAPPYGGTLLDRLLGFVIR